MAETPMIQARQDYTIQKPQPIQVNNPTATQKAAVGVRPNQVQLREAASNHQQAAQVLSNIGNRTLGTLAAFSPVIAQKLKDVEDQEFADGYMRHLQGESVASIAEQQTFGDLFGDGAAVRGARARQQETAGQSVMQYVMQNQGDLSRMSLDEQRIAVGEFVSNLGTGDSVADAQIAMGAMKMMPAVMDNLARTASAETQRQAGIEQADAMAAAGESLKYARSQFETGQMDEANYAALQANYIQMAGPLPGQSQASYRSALTGQIMQLSKDGSHEMANLVYDKILRGDLQPEERIQMEAQMKDSQAQWLLNNPQGYDHTEYRNTLGSQISGGRYSTQESLTEDIDRRNQDYRIETGALEPLIDNKEKSRRVAEWQDWQTRQEASNAKLMQGEMDAAAKRGLYVDGYAKGSPAQMAMSGLDKQTAFAVEQNEAQKFFTGDANSSMVLGKLAANGHLNPAVSEAFSTQMGILRGGGIPKAENLVKVQGAYNQLMATPYGAAAVDAYFKDDLQIVQQMAQMDPENPANVQGLREMVNAKKARATISKDTQTAADSLVDDELSPGKFSRWFGDGQTLGLGYEASLKDEMKRHAADLMSQNPNWSEDNILKAAKGRTLRGKDIAGNMVITGGQPGSFIKGLNQYLDVKVGDPADTRVNSFINDAIKAKVPNDLGFEVGALSMLPDNQTVVATVMRDNGSQQAMVLRLSDIAATQNTKAKRAVVKDRENSVKPAQMASGFVEEAKRQEDYRNRNK